MLARISRPIFCLILALAGLGLGAPGRAAETSSEPVVISVKKLTRGHILWVIPVNVCSIEIVSSKKTIPEHDLVFAVSVHGRDGKRVMRDTGVKIIGESRPLVFRFPQSCESIGTIALTGFGCLKDRLRNPVPVKCSARFVGTPFTNGAVGR